MQNTVMIKPMYWNKPSKHSQVKSLLFYLVTAESINNYADNFAIASWHCQVPMKCTDLSKNRPLSTSSRWPCSAQIAESVNDFTAVQGSSVQRPQVSTPKMFISLPGNRNSGGGKDMSVGRALHQKTAYLCTAGMATGKCFAGGQCLMPQNEVAHWVPATGLCGPMPPWCAAQLKGDRRLDARV